MNITNISFKAHIIFNDSYDKQAINKSDKSKLAKIAKDLPCDTVEISLEKGSVKVPKSKPKITHNLTVKQGKYISQISDLPYKTNMFETVRGELDKLSKSLKSDENANLSETFGKNTEKISKSETTKKAALKKQNKSRFTLQQREQEEMENEKRLIEQEKEIERMKAQKYGAAFKNAKITFEPKTRKFLEKMYSKEELAYLAEKSNDMVGTLKIDIEDVGENVRNDFRYNIKLSKTYWSDTECEQSVRRAKDSNSVFDIICNYISKYSLQYNFDKWIRPNYSIDNILNKQSDDCCNLIDISRKIYSLNPLGSAKVRKLTELAQQIPSGTISVFSDINSDGSFNLEINSDVCGTQSSKIFKKVSGYRLYESIAQVIKERKNSVENIKNALSEQGNHCCKLQDNIKYSALLRLDKNQVKNLVNLTNQIHKGEINIGLEKKSESNYDLVVKADIGKFNIERRYENADNESICKNLEEFISTAKILSDNKDNESRAKLIYTKFMGLEAMKGMEKRIDELEETVKKLSETVGKQAELISKLFDFNKYTSEDIQKLSPKIKKFRGL